jgi:hypothetical protein
MTRSGKVLRDPKRSVHVLHFTLSTLALQASGTKVGINASVEAKRLMAMKAMEVLSKA